MAVIPLQYDLFDSTDEVSILRKEVESIHSSSENVRRGLFARHKKLETAFNELLNMHLQQQEEIAKMRSELILMRNK